MTYTLLCHGCGMAWEVTEDTASDIAGKHADLCEPVAERPWPNAC